MTPSVSGIPCTTVISLMRGCSANIRAANLWEKLALSRPASMGRGRARVWPVWGTADDLQGLRNTKEGRCMQVALLSRRCCPPALHLPGLCKRAFSWEVGCSYFWKLYVPAAGGYSVL